MKIRKLPQILREEGLYGIWWRLGIRTIGDPYQKKYEKSYRSWYKKNKPTPELLAEMIQAQHNFKINPLISVITPVFNPKIEHLKECIESVMAQSYKKWELILVDDASTNEKVWSTLQEYSARDERIRIFKRKKNGHICRASNDGIKHAVGDWIALLDNDDYLWPNALFQVVNRINDKPNSQFLYTDEDKITENGRTHCEPFFKPNWSPHYLRSINYITHFAVINTELVKTVGSFRTGTEGAQDWDLFLRVTRELEKRGHCHPWDPKCPIQHIDTVLYSWRKSPTSTSSSKHAFTAKKYAYDAQSLILQNDLNARGGGLVAKTKYIGVLAVQPKLHKKPLISIIIPTKDNIKYLSDCLDSVCSKTTYKNFEILVVDTGSKDQDTWDYYYDLRGEIKIIKFSNPVFNYSAAVNFGAKKAKGDYLLFLNDDTSVRTTDWLQQLLSFAQLPEVGAIGCRLLYPNEKIQHTGLIVGHEDGIVLGEKGFVSNYFRMADPNRNYGIPTLLIDTIRDYTAVTAACMMISSVKHKIVGGFDESLAIAFNDVDYCLKLQQKKLFNVVLPTVLLTHHESVSVGRPEAEKRELKQFAAEIKNMNEKWGDKVVNDHYYSSKYTLDAMIAS